MLREHWPSTLWYALTPGLTLAVVAQILRRGHSGTVALALSAAIAGLVGLWFKGAIVTFYLRHEPSRPAS